MLDTNIEFFDGHSHSLEKQKGGLLIGLEGKPQFENCLDNSQVFKVAKEHPLIVPVFYINKKFPPTDSNALKYHPRREGYSPELVIRDLKTRSAKIVIIDTLNEPFWSYQDYWKITKQFPEKYFILAHCGGLDVMNFIKVIMFEKNVYSDFSFTQTLFGFTGERTRHFLICEAIEYCLENPKINEKIFFGSDNPFTSQINAIKPYLKRKNANNFLRYNLENLIDKAGI